MIKLKINNYLESDEAIYDEKFNDGTWYEFESLKDIDDLWTEGCRNIELIGTTYDDINIVLNIENASEDYYLVLSIGGTFYPD